MLEIILEYRLNLGPNDALERVVQRLSEISHMKSSEKKDVILEYLDVCDDKEVLLPLLAIATEVTICSSSIDRKIPESLLFKGLSGHIASLVARIALSQN